MPLDILHLAAPCRNVPVTSTLERMEDPVALLRSALSSGASLEDALGRLKLAGATPVEAIKAVREVKGVGLGEAKTLFALSPAWSKEQHAAVALHDEIFSTKTGDRN